MITTTTKKQQVTLEESKDVAASKSSIKYAVGILKTRKDVDQIEMKDVQNFKCAILSVGNQYYYICLEQTSIVYRSHPKKGS